MTVIIIKSYSAAYKIRKSKYTAAEIRMPENTGIKHRSRHILTGIPHSMVHLFSYTIQNRLPLFYYPMREPKFVAFLLFLSDCGACALSSLTISLHKEQCR